MCDVGEWATVDERRVVFKCLHQIWLHRLLQQNSHRAVGFDVAAINWCAIAAVSYDNVAKAFFQIGEIVGKAKNRHNFRGNRDIETGLTREAVCNTTKRSNYITKCAVVHVQNAAPNNAARIDFQLVTPVNVVVDHCGQ